MRRLLAWVVAERTSARIAFSLRTVCMALNAMLSLVWTPLLLHALGAEKYGTFMAFAAFLGLATAGEFGLGGAVAIRTNQLTAAGDLDGLRRLHALARRLFLTLAVLMMVAVLVLSPWLPGWLGFQELAGAGPLAWLFAAGAVSAALSVFISYVNNSIYAAGSVVWPVVPAFAFGQMMLAATVLLGWMVQPLWVLQAAVALLGVGQLAAMWAIYRHSHPVFREALPWRFDRVLLRDLAGTSFWSYLFGLSSLIYVSTDRLVVNAFFGAGTVPLYQLNYKLCELALALVITAGAVSMPKLVNLLLSANAGSREHGAAQTTRLAQFQALLGFAAGLGYLWGNDLFIRALFGAEYFAPPVLQAGFVVTLLLAANADVFIQLCGRLETKGLRLAAVVVMAAALLNLALSILAAAWLRWMPGVAWATFVAQLGSFFVIAEYVRRRDRLGPRGLILWRSLVAPLLFLGVAFAAKTALPPDSWTGGAALALVFALLLAAYGRVVGPRWGELMEEFASVRRLFKPAG